MNKNNKILSNENLEQISGGSLTARLAAGALAVMPLIGLNRMVVATNTSSFSHVSAAGQREGGKKILSENSVSSIITKGGFTNVIQIEENGKKMYFKECREMTESNQYVLETIDRYAEFFSLPEEARKLIVESLQSNNPLKLPDEFYEYVKKLDYKSLGLKEYGKNGEVYNFEHKAEFFKKAIKIIIENLENSKNIERFFNMDVFWRPYKPYGIYKKTGCLEVLGFPKELNSVKNFDFDNFLVYCCNEFNSYYMNKDKKIGETQDYIAEKYALTDVFSKAFGVEKLCVQSEFTDVKFPDGKMKTGVLMNEVSGLDIYETLKKFGKNPELMKIIDPNLQKDLTSLQIVDTLLWQTNHMPYNYKIICEEYKIKSICSFSHTAALYDPVKFCRPSIKGSDTTDSLNLSEKFYHNLSTLLTKEGLINLPYMSAELANKFNTVDIDKILSETTITETQKQNIETRFEMIKNAINKTVESNSNFLVKDGNWSKQTMQEELDYIAKNGKTYFQKLCAFNMFDWWA